MNTGKLTMPFATVLNLIAECLRYSWLEEKQAIISTFLISATSGTGSGNIDNIKEYYKLAHVLMLRLHGRVGTVEGMLPTVLFAIETPKGAGVWADIREWEVIHDRKSGWEDSVERKISNCIGDAENKVEGQGLKSSFSFYPNGMPRIIRFESLQMDELKCAVTFPALGQM